MDDGKQSMTVRIDFHGFKLDEAFNFCAESIEDDLAGYTSDELLAEVARRRFEVAPCSICANYGRHGAVSATFDVEVE